MVGVFALWHIWSMTTVVLELLYANQDQLVGYLRIPQQQRQRYLEDPNGDSQTSRASKQQGLTALLETRLNEAGSDQPGELQTELLAGRLHAGQVVSIEQDFYFRNDRSAGTVLMHGKLNTDRAIKLEATLSTSRFPFSSTREHLSGQSHIYSLATITSIEPGLIKIRPQFVGWRNWDSSAPGQGGGNSDSRQVHPQHIDQFAQVDWGRGASSRELQTVKGMPEDTVKTYLAEIIGHPFEERDWGGERSDLNIDNLLVHGVQTSSAWLLKGRSVQRTMQIADLGANGDQVERLTTTGAELLVVQHNQLISAPVKNLLAAFAFDMRNPRQYMLIDGNITAMIFRDYQKI